MSITTQTKKMLCSRSGGFCQNPGCHKDFYVLFGNGEITSIEELAHIIPKSDSGPRSCSSSPRGEIDEFENIILLCPNCHTLVDKESINFPIEVLRRWKSEHQEKIEALFKDRHYETKTDLREEIHRLLGINKSIFDEYGPFSHLDTNPLSDSKRAWDQRVIESILPNNRKVRRLLESHIHFLSELEKVTLNKFILHQEAFEYNNLSGDKNASAPLFPKEMDFI